MSSLLWRVLRRGGIVLYGAVDRTRYGNSFRKVLRFYSLSKHLTVHSHILCVSAEIPIRQVPEIKKSFQLLSLLHAMKIERSMRF